MKRYLCLLLFLFTSLIKPLAKNYVEFGPENLPEGPSLSASSTSLTNALATIRETTSGLPARARLVNSPLLSEQERRRIAIEIINEQIRLSASQRRHSSPYSTAQSQTSPPRTPDHLRLRRYPAFGRERHHRHRQRRHFSLSRYMGEIQPRNILHEHQR
jgi:hypothetical protein